MDSTHILYEVLTEHVALGYYSNLLQNTSRFQRLFSKSASVWVPRRKGKGLYAEGPAPHMLKCVLSSLKDGGVQLGESNLDSVIRLDSPSPKPTPCPAAS